VPPSLLGIGKIRRPVKNNRGTPNIHSVTEQKTEEKRERKHGLECHNCLDENQPTNPRAGKSMFAQEVLGTGNVARHRAKNFGPTGPVNKSKSTWKRITQEHKRARGGGNRRGERRESTSPEEWVVINKGARSKPKDGFAAW